MNAERWIITVRAEGDGPPIEIRVRQFLKRALRGYGLRATAVECVEAVPAAGPGVAQAASGDQQGAVPPPAARPRSVLSGRAASRGPAAD